MGHVGSAGAEVLHLYTTAAVFLSFLTSFFILYPVYCFGSIYAVYHVSESVKRVLVFKGKHYITKDWRNIRWDIGCNLLGETKIWDIEAPGISRKKLHAIHYGGSILMVPIVIILAILMFVTGFSFKNIQEPLLLFLFTTFFLATIFTLTGFVCWMHMPTWEKELNSK